MGNKYFYILKDKNNAENQIKSDLYFEMLHKIDKLKENNLYGDFELIHYHYNEKDEMWEQEKIKEISIKEK